MARRTISRPGSVQGIGLHTGAETTLSCHPAASGNGIVFRRIDLDGSPEVPARISEVDVTDRHTAIGHGEKTIHTVEHLLAAVAAHRLDDVVFEIDGPEPPILDGSFRPFYDLLSAADPTDQDGEPMVYKITAPLQIKEGDSSYVVAPADDLRVTATIDFPHPLIGTQVGSYAATPEVFEAELADSRTFGFMAEVDTLRAKGLIKGASTANAIVLSEDGVIDSELRWPDEFVRHKAGDMLGDLALIGGRIEAHIVAVRPSHRGNIALALAIARTAEPRGGYAMDIGQIFEILPHRYPFLLVDRIVEVEGTRRCVGIKNVTINEPFFQGHFPGHPIMPGVLIIEAMAQVGGMLLMHTMDDRDEKVVYFMSLDKVKFRRPVVPGDQIRFELEMLKSRGATCQMQGKAFVDGKLAAEAIMMARVIDK